MANNETTNWKERDSSNILKDYYEPATSTLYVQFKSGGVYKYLNVPPGEYAGYDGAVSQGKYLNTYIKGTYGCEKVN